MDESATQKRSASDSIAANAQHDPQSPWLRIAFMLLHVGQFFRASKDAGMDPDAAAAAATSAS